MNAMYDLYLVLSHILLREHDNHQGGPGYYQGAIPHQPRLYKLPIYKHMSCEYNICSIFFRVFTV